MRLLLSITLVMAYGFAQPKIVFPQFIEGPQWVTVIRIANLHGSRRQFPATFYRSDGSLWNDLGLWLRTGGSAETDGDGRFEFAASGGGATEWHTFEVKADEITNAGYAVIESNPGLTQVSGFLEYHPDGNLTGTPAARVGVASAPQATWMAGVFSNYTAIAIANPSDRELRVFLKMAARGFHNPPETLAPMSIAPWGSLAIFLHEASTQPIGLEFFGQFNVWTEGGEPFYPILLDFPPSGVFTSLSAAIRESSPLEANMLPKLDDLPVLELADGVGKTELNLQMMRTFQFRVPRDSLELRASVQPSDAADVGEIALSNGRATKLEVKSCSNAQIGPAQCSFSSPEAGIWFISGAIRGIGAFGTMRVEILR